MSGRINETNQKTTYDLYLLKDGKDDNLVLAHQEVKGGNAVLVFPVDQKRGEKSYHACFIRDGQFVAEANDPGKFKEVDIGKHDLKGIGLLKKTPANMARPEFIAIRSPFFCPRVRLSHNPRLASHRRQKPTLPARSAIQCSLHCESQYR